MRARKTSLPAGRNLPLHIGLFLATILTTLWAGASWSGTPIGIASPGELAGGLAAGLPYSLSLLLFLGTHEFGHFFAARAHQVRVSLPFFIPVPPLPFLLSLGTMGAVIKIGEPMPNSDALVDTATAGPLAGIAVSAALILFGSMGLPPEHLIAIRPEYQEAGTFPAIMEGGSLVLGKNLLWIIMEAAIAPRGFPPMSELYRYPILFAGWIGTFVTALNLIPVGQLDGGHITYALFGRKGHRIGAGIFLALIATLGLPSLIELFFSAANGAAPSPVPQRLLEWSWPGWILWAALLGTVLGTSHPPTLYDHRLGPSRKVAGWLSITVFVLTFTPIPFTIT